MEYFYFTFWNSWFCSDKSGLALNNNESINYLELAEDLSRINIKQK
jgi:hypothetical protein